MCLVTKAFPEGASIARDMTKHFSNPGMEHWKAAGRLAGRLKKAKGNAKLTHRKLKESRASNSADSDHGCSEDRRSASGNVGTLGGCTTD